MHGDLAQPAAAGYHDGKSRASASPPLRQRGERKKAVKPRAPPFPTTSEKSREGTRTLPHGRAGSRFPPAINASAKAAKIKRKRALKKWRATPVNHPALGARLRAPARAGILAPSPRFGKFDALAAKTAGPPTQENFSPHSELQRRFCGCKSSSYFFPNTDDLTPPAHTTQ